MRLAAAGAALPGGWKARGAGRAPLAEVALVRDADVTVLEVRSHASAGAAALALRADTQSRPILAWRWKVDRVVQGADLSRREGDAVPAVTGVVAGNDTDKTGESATARFGDLRLEARP